MPKRTLQNCSLIKKYGKPEQYNGLCEGFGRSENDDEPCEICKECKLHYLYYDDKTEYKDICRPCAEALKADGKVKIGTSKKYKSTCSVCKRRRFVYECEVLK